MSQQQQQQQQQQKQFQVEVIDIYEQKEKSKKKHSKHASYLRDVNSNSLQRKSRLISKKVPVVLICTYSALKISVEIEVQDFGNKCLAINLCAFCTRDFQSLKPDDENYPRLRQAESSRKDASDTSSFSAHSSGNFSFNSFSTTPAAPSMTPTSGAAVASGSVNMGSDASNSGSFSNNSQQQQQQQQQQQAPPLSVSCEIIKVQKLETAPGWTRYTFNIPIAHLKDRQFKAPLRLGFEGIYCGPDQNANDHNVPTFQGWLHALPLMSIYTNAAFFYQDRSYSQAAFSLFSQVLPVRVITDPTYSYFPLYTPDVPASSSQLSTSNSNSGANPASGSSSTSSSSEMSSPLCGVSTSASVSSTPMSVDDTMTSSAHLVGAQTSSTTAGATTSLRGSQTMADDVLQVIDAVMPKQEPSPLTAKNSPTMTIEVIRFFDMVQIVDAFFQFVAQMDESWSFCLQSEENIQWLLSILSLSQFQQQPPPVPQPGSMSSNSSNGSGQTDGVPAFFPTTASVLIYDDPVTGKPIRCFEFADIVQLFSPLHQCAGSNPPSSREAKQNYCVLRQVALTISKIPNHIRLGDVLGVLSHRRAHRLLHNQRPGTYLLRISPSRPSSVVITYVRKDCPHEEIAGMTIVSELTDELLDSCVRSISHLINPDQLYLRGAKRFRSSSFMLESYGSHAQIISHSHVHSHGHQLQSSPSHLLSNNHAVPQMVSVPSSSANYTSYPTAINIDTHRGQTSYPAMTSPATSPPSSNDFFVPSHFHQNLSALSFDLSNAAVPASPSLVNNGGHNANNSSGQRPSLWNPNLIQIESPLSSLFSYTDVSDSTPSHFLEESGTVFAISHNSSSNLNNSHTPNQQQQQNQQHQQQQHQQQMFGDGGNGQFVGNQQGNKMNFSPVPLPAAPAPAPVPMQLQSGPPAKLIKLVFRFKDQAAPIKVTSDTTFRKVVNELIQMFQWNVQVESLRLYDSDGCLRMFDSLVTEEESEFILHPIS